MNERQKAEQIMAFVDSNIFRDAFRTVDKRLVQTWKNAPTLEERELQHIKQKVLRDVRGELVDTVLEIAREYDDTGEMKTWVKQTVNQYED